MWLLRRGLMTVIVIWLAVTLTFFALRVLPGDAITAQLTRLGLPAEIIDERRMLLGLDAPVWQQYMTYLGGLLRGDLGTSLLSGQSVTGMVAGQFIPTAQLAGLALVFATVFGVALGTVSVLDVGWGGAALGRLLITLSLSTPLYFTGTMAIFIFSVWLDLLPSAGGARLSQLILPVAVLGFHTAGSIARVTQTGLHDARDAAFLVMARAKGLPRSLIWRRHWLRVGLIPVVSVVALQAGFLLGGAVITESLFVRPGLGRLLLDATLRQDYPVVQGIVVLAAMTYALLSLAADLLYSLLDPRSGTLRTA